MTGARVRRAPAIRLEDLDPITASALAKRLAPIPPARARRLLAQLAPDPVARITTERGHDGAVWRWHVVLVLPPRSKKNHLQWLGKQGRPYLQFAAGVRAAVLPWKREFALPIPRAIPLRMSGTVYVDRYGKTADVFGLLQATADALEAAEFFTNDHQVRGLGHVDIVTDDPEPRLDLTFTRIDKE
jgi:hypothetical protein